MKAFLIKAKMTKDLRLQSPTEKFSFSGSVNFSSLCFQYWYFKYFFLLFYIIHMKQIQLKLRNCFPWIKTTVFSDKTAHQGNVCVPLESSRKTFVLQKTPSSLPCPFPLWHLLVLQLTQSQWHQEQTKSFFLLDAGHPNPSQIYI